MPVTNYPPVYTYEQTTPYSNYPPVYTPIYTTPETTTTTTTTTTTSTTTTTTTSTTKTTTLKTTHASMPNYPPVYTPNFSMPDTVSYATAHTSRTHIPTTQTITHNPYQPQQTSFSPVQTKQPLYCYSCNENQAACSLPTLNLQRLNTEHYVPCNGQCMQYQNQWDNYSN